MRTTARTTRVAAYAASAALALTGVGLASAPAGATQAQGSSATSWLAGQLSGGLLPGQYGGGDVGLSIDAGLALEATGGQAAAVSAIADAVQGSAGADYVEYTYSYDSDGNGTAENYAGQAANATGKALAYLQSLPTPRSTIGSIDLRSRMEALTTDSGATAGRIVDVSTKDGVPDGQDYANTLGQSFAVRGLSAAGSSEAPAALAFLLQQQCPGGGFRLSFAAPSAAQQCTDGSAAAVDATALSVASLQTVPTSSAVTTAIAAARSWLVSQQGSDGSFGGGAGTSGANSNSTGLAASALGDTPAGRKAAAWVAARQLTTGADAGAIAYDDAALAAGRSGIDSTARDQWHRATAQAAPALLLATTSTLSLSAPTGFRKAGTRLTLRTSGAGNGDRLTLSGPGAGASTVSDGRAWDRAVTLPAGTATRTYKVTDGSRTATRAVKVLGSARLSVARSKYRVKKGRFVTVTVRYLAPGERAAVIYKGRAVRIAYADAKGSISARFRVGHVKGVKTVSAVGQFTDVRRGSTTIKVVR